MVLDGKLGEIVCAKLCPQTVQLGRHEIEAHAGRPQEIIMARWRRKPAQHSNENGGNKDKIAFI